jgi:benzil reductase ((S)-benzoin forming)
MNQTTAKLALVSGGSRGLGAALVEEFTAREFRVLEFSRTAPHACSVHCDFSIPQQVSELVAQSLEPLAQKAWDEIVLVNNAGTLAPMGPVSQKNPLDVIANTQVNFTSPVLWISEAMRVFQSQACPKTVVNISSGAAAKGYAGWSLYCAAKAGLENFVRALALEQALQTHPFTAINIVPGVIDTGMQESIRNADLADFPTRARFVQLKESGSLSSPQKVALAVLKILASDPKSGERYDVANFF